MASSIYKIKQNTRTHTHTYIYIYTFINLEIVQIFRESFKRVCVLMYVHMFVEYTVKTLSQNAGCFFFLFFCFFLYDLPLLFLWISLLLLFNIKSLIECCLLVALWAWVVVNCFKGIIIYANLYTYTYTPISNKEQKIIIEQRVWNKRRQKMYKEKQA